MIFAVVMWALPWWMFGVPDSRTDVGAFIGITFVSVTLGYIGFSMRGWR